MVESPFDVVIPRHATLKHIVDRYGPLPDKIPCGLQNCRTGNQNGFLVAFVADGIENVGAIGRVCGANHFGSNWHTQEKIYQEKERAKAIADRIQKFLPEADRVLSQITLTQSELSRLNEQRKSLMATTPGFFKYCIDAARMRDGWVGENVGRTFVRALRIEGVEFFSQNAPVSTAKILKDDIERLQGRIQHGKLPDDELASRAAELGNISKRWESITEWIAAAHGALSRDNLIRVTSVYAEKVNDLEIRISHNQKWLLAYDPRNADFRHNGWVKLFHITDSVE